MKSAQRLSIGRHVMWFLVRDQFEEISFCALLLRFSFPILVCGRSMLDLLVASGEKFFGGFFFKEL